LAFTAGSDVELDALSFVEGAVAAALDVRVVDEHIVALLTSDEAEALLGIEEFYGAYSQLILFSERGTTRAVVSGLVTLPDPPLLRLTGRLSAHPPVNVTRCWIE
jgi:hypothetical protein